MDILLVFSLFSQQLANLKEDSNQAMVHLNGEQSVPMDPPPDLPPRFLNPGLISSSQVSVT